MLVENVNNREVSRLLDHFAGFEFSSPLLDGTVKRISDTSRRRVRCRFPGVENDPVLCLAAWHGVLHWLRYNDEPIATPLLNGSASQLWPLITELKHDITMAELYDLVQTQWPKKQWFSHDSSTSLWLKDQLPVHVVRLVDIAVKAEDRAEFEVIRTDEGWVLDCAVSCFTEAYQEKLCAIWEQFVNAILETPDAFLSSQTYCNDDYAGWQVTGPALPLSGNLVKRFLKWVEKKPNSVAVKDEHNELTYQQLNERSSAWAMALMQSGVKVDTAVGVCFQRNLNMVVAQLAVLKAGGVFVPMDSEQPQTRLASIVEDAELALVLTEACCAESLREKLPQTELLISEKIPHIAANKIKLPATSQLNIESLAYIIFTSGSTGRPKGVKITHGNLLNFVNHIERCYISGDDVFSQFAPFTFDASVAEIHCGIMNGVPLCILSKDLIDNPDTLQAYMTEQKVTFAAFPPQYARYLSPNALPYLRTLLTAGSAPDLDLVQRWYPHVNYINAYGPTETTILSTAWDATYLPSRGEPIVIGSPIINTDVRVVNRFGHALPEGMVGELQIGGAGVSKGYLKHDDLNKTVFVEDKGNRWYRSGDLSCMNKDKEFIFAGRVDSQIKLRGHRLEPGEVEAALNRLDCVDHSAAVAININGTTQLIVFCQGKKVAESQLRDKLQPLLPAWAMPNRIFWLAALPLTVSGKFDYRALKTQAAQFVNSSEKEKSEFEDETEAQVAEIWQNVLGVPAVAREDNFIHLGGDSLTSLVVMSALKRLGYVVTSSQLLANPRLADFARLLRQQDREGARRYLNNYDSCTGSAPLSPIQGWFFDLQLDNPDAFCQTLVFDAQPTLDPVRLQKALVRLVEYHDELRAYFNRTDTVVDKLHNDSKWQQTIDAESLQIPAISVVQTNNDALSETAEQMRISLANELNIEQAPLFRMALLQTENTSRVVWVIHHLVTDTISHGILLDDLYHLYYGEDKATETLLPGKSISYFEWSHKLLQNVNGNADTLLKQWQPVLDAAANADQLPLAAPTVEPSLSTEYCVFSIEQTKQLIEQAGQCYHQSLEELVLASVFVGLAKTFKIKNVGIDIEWHGRDEAFAGLQGIERSVGWFTSVHPLHMTVPQDMDLANWLIDLKEARASIHDRGRDFYALRYMSKTPQVRDAFDQYRGPQVLFNFSGVMQRSNKEWQTVPVVAIEKGEGNKNPYLLAVESEIRNNQLRIGLYIDKNIWQKNHVSSFQQAINESLDEIIIHCCSKQNHRWTPSDFPLLNLSMSQLDQLPADVRDVYPLTDMQQTMYRHTQTYQVWMHYNMPRVFNQEAFDKAVASWVERHDCLRTVIKAWDDETTAQVVLASNEPSIAVHKIKTRDQELYAKELIAKDREKQVSITQTPPYKLVVLDSDEEHFSVILSIHHIIHDGWSIELLLQDLFDSYLYFMGEREVLPSAPMASVKDLVVAQHRLAADENWKSYWSNQPWGNEYAKLPAFKDSANPELRNIELYVNHVHQALVDKVNKTSQKLGVTANSVWLSAYLLMLRYLGGQQQVRCGVIQNGRPETISGVESITGCCVNTLPMLIDIDASAMLQEIVTRVNSRLMDMRDCAAFPLSHIHAMAKQKSDAEVFESLFNIESGNYGQQLITDKPQLLGGYESTNYKFIFGLIEGVVDAKANGGIGLRIGYDSSNYREEDIASWVAVYKEIVSLITGAGDQPWSELNPMPQTLWKQITQWNDTRQDYPQDRCLHQYFEAQVAQTPQAVAIVFENQTLTYAELNSRANQLANYLRSQGVGPDVLVGICAERSLEMVIGLYGILKAGGAYVPLDPDYPSQRLAYIINDTKLPIALAQEKFRNALSTAEAEVLSLDTQWHLVADEPVSPPATAITPDNLAYVIYTSGSTGKPKGVCIEHKGIVNRLLWMQEEYHLGVSDCILQKTPFGFDVSVWEFFWPLMTGARLVVAKPNGHKDAAYLVKLIAKEHITTLHFVPPMLAVFLEESGLEACGTITRVFCSGEALPYDLMKKHYAKLGAPLHNLYGPTEASVDVTYWPCDPNTKLSLVPIGRPVANTKLYIVNREMKPVPVGVPGELLIGGAQLARGYLNRPELNAEKFIRDPFSDDVHAKLYRTGDLARYLPDGNIEFLGRLDFQVKIRGFRIELGEIEAVISTVDEIKQVLVMARDERGQKQLNAYVTHASAEPLQDDAKSALIETIRTRLNAELPDYMVPSAFIVLDKMPLNANGKIDRKQLSLLDDRVYARGDIVAPINDVEQKLWAIWVEILGSDQFGVTDNFFSIGGDSILAIQVVAGAARQNMKLTTRELFECKTIAALAKLQAPASAIVADDVKAVDFVEKAKGEQRLLPAQLRLLRSNTDYKHASQQVIVTLPQNVSIKTLAPVYSALTERHDIFRLKFRGKGTNWSARYMDEALDYNDIIEEAEHTEIAEIVSTAQQSIDTKTGKLCRWVLLREAEQSRLLWVMHQLVVDEISWKVLLHDFHRALEQLADGKMPTLGAAVSSYQSWASSLYDYAFENEIENEKTYWLRELQQGQPTTSIEGCTSDSGIDSETVTVSLNACQTKQMLEQANDCYQTHADDLLLTALSMSLPEWLGEDSMQIEMQTSGRSLANSCSDLISARELSSTVGHFSSGFPLTLATTEGDTGIQIQTSKKLLKTVPNNGIGYGVLRYIAEDEEILDALEGDAYHEPQIVFNTLALAGGLDVAVEQIRPVRSHAMEIRVGVIENTLHVNFVFSPQLAEVSVVTSLADRFITALLEIIDHCTSGPTGPNPSKFPLASLAKSDIESLAQRYADFNDVYPATGMQQGLLMFAARDAEQGAYITQIRVMLKSVNVEMLRQSWQQLLQRHDILRTAFLDLGKESLLQVVLREAELPWQEVDWRVRATHIDSLAQLNELFEQERLATFDEAQAPLMRILMMRHGESQYEMVWTYHHAIIDGWSMAVLMRELFNIYDKLSNGTQRHDFEGEPYKKYIEWLNARDFSAAECYWKNLLNGFEGITQLTLPAPVKNKNQNNEQKSHKAKLNASTTARLKQLAMENGVTLSTVMQAAWGLLISKYSGEKDIVFGYTVSGRPAELPGVESMVGLFINSIPMRLVVSPDTELGEWLKAIQKQQMENEDHSFVPLVDIQRWAGYKQGLFDTLLVVENLPLDHRLIASESGIAVDGVESTGRNELQLNLVVFPGDELQFELAYQTNRFSEQATDALLSHVCQLLSSMSQGANQRLSQIEMLNVHETERAIKQWNNTQLDYPKQNTLADLFTQKSNEFSSLPALVYEGEVWTFKQLRQRVDAIANWLNDAGVKAGDFVALSLEKEHDLVAAMLGILQVGAAYVPVAVDCPPTRREFIIDDAKIRWVLTKSEYPECAALPGVTALNIDQLPQKSTNKIAKSAITSPITPQDPAYVIYTSGTTGHPKGVAVTHQNLVNFCFWFMSEGWIKTGDATIQFAPYTFDASVSEIFCSIFSGATLHMPSGSLIQDPGALTQYMVDKNIRFGGFPPPYMQLMQVEKLPSDITVLSAGSAPTLEMVQRWGSHCGYINAYGPTETTILSSAWRYNTQDLAIGTLPIGKPIANTVIYVLDNEGQLCPPGVIGEICIGGDGVTLGYLNRPELTKKHYIENPWSRDGRLYKTGDLGRWLDDGSIEFAGRRDHQVKIRGFRIELSGIETELSRNTSIKDATVQVIGTGSEKLLAAWLVPQDDVIEYNADLFNAPRDFIQAVREALRSALPDYMIPSAFMLIPALPLTANGKLDLKALPAPDLSTQAAEYIAPRNEMEQALVKVWARVLKLNANQVSVTANFFEIGGHSLLATRLVNEIARRMGVRMPVRWVFEHNTIAAMATKLHGAEANSDAIQAVDRKQPLVLSYAQQRLWFIDQLEGVSTQYNQPFVMRLQGALDKRDLQRTFNTIIKRHEILRTVYVSNDEQPFQKILDNDALPISHINIAKLNSAVKARKLQEIIVNEAAKPFNLSTDLMIRVSLVETDSDDHYLLVTLHHIASDGWSVSILMNELTMVYEAYAKGDLLDLGQLPVQYADFAHWQRNHLQGEVLEIQLQYWRNKLNALPLVHSLPLDKPRPRDLSYNGAGLTTKISAELTEKLRAIGQEHQATLFMVLYAAFGLVLSRYSGQTDIVVGTTTANRDHEDIEKLIGFFTNTLVLRGDFSGQQTFQALLEQCRNTALEAYAHKDLPFDQLVDDLQPQRSLSYNPIFQIMLSMDNVDEVKDITLGELNVNAVTAEQQMTAQFDLNLDVGETDGHLSFNWVYATDIFEHHTIATLARHFNQLLEAVVGDPGKSIGKINFLSPDEQQQLVEHFNDTVDESLLTKTWPELFAQQAEQTPDRVVALCGGEQLTFSQLQQRSTQLAHALKARGVGQGDVIGLLEQRGIDLMVMIAGVLKAGAAYLPLDETQPQDRWLSILTEARPAQLLVGKSLTGELNWIQANWNAKKTLACAALESENLAGGEHLSYPSLDDLAYVIYTSGSTGKPKGVMIEHRGMINNMLSKYEPLSLSANDVIAQTASQSFDISVWQFLIAPLLGAKVSIIPNKITRDPQALLTRLREHEVSIWEPVPSVMQAALTMASPLPSLRWVLPTGEALSATLVSQWFAQYPQIPLMNAYGPAECSDDVCLQPIHSPVERVTIGKPVTNAHLHVVDDQLNLVPIGVVGELAVSGPVVGRGYQHASELTDAVFKQNPYSRYKGDECIYLTGDLVRRLQNGSLEYIGRKDFQVKIRGFRIELEEVEAKMTECPGVKTAVATALDTNAVGNELVAYVVLDQGRVQVDDLKAALKSQLPDYMVPSVFVQMDELPLNDNGKIDRKRLPAPDKDALLDVDYVAPEGEVEQAIAEVWRKLLDVERVGRNDNFFNLGGNSILIVLMVTKLKQRNVELAVNDIYQADTLAACARIARLTTESLPEWLSEQDISHRFCTVRNGTQSTVILLIDESHREQTQAIKMCVANLDQKTLPDYIRFCGDIDKQAARIKLRGLKALTELQPKSMPELKPMRNARIRHMLRTEVIEYSTNLLAQPVRETIEMSPMQRQMLQWSARDTMDCVTVSGWFKPAELQEAFAKLVVEQDMLRAVMNGKSSEWALLDFKADGKRLPVIDLRGMNDGRFSRTANNIALQLQKIKSQIRLPYVAAWISESDTKHHLMIVNDHLISDGACSAVFRSRLLSYLLPYLNHETSKPQHTFREYVNAVWNSANQENYGKATDILGLKKVASNVKLTREALEKRCRFSHRVMKLEMPLSSDESPLAQAFDCFRCCIKQLTQMKQFTMVMNHHGRRLGSHQYFDQIGLFLDKIPFVVDDDTSICSINDRIAALEKENINYLALEKSDAVNRIATSLDMRHEILFNFVGELTKGDSAVNQLGDRDLIKKLRDFNGILFEAYVRDNKLLVSVVFRGNKSDMTTLNRVNLINKEKSAIDNRTIDSTINADIALTKSPAAIVPYSLEVDNVRKRYGDFEAVKGVSFKVKTGSCFGILGPNGAGKTSLLGMIEGITPITSGSIRVLGMDVKSQIKQIQPHVGVQLQQNNYFQFLTVLELLKFYKAFRSANDRKTNSQSLNQLLERLNLLDKKHCKVEELSGGQKQRLSIAIALLEDPDVLFLDEPTSALDPHSRHYTWDFIEQLKRSTNKTVILTTHYMEEAERLCDELLIMNNGEIISQGTPSELVSSLKPYHEISLQFANSMFNEAILHGMPGIVEHNWDEAQLMLNIKTVQFTDTVKQLLNLCEEKNLEIAHFDVNRPNLEDVFLSHTGNTEEFVI